VFDARRQRIELFRVVADNVGHPVPQARRKELASLSHQKACLCGPAANAGGGLLRPRFEAFLANVAARGVAIGQADTHRHQLARPGAQAAQVLANIILAANHKLEVGAHETLRGGAGEGDQNEAPYSTVPEMRHS
jgi:hypothetical protein